MQIVLIASDIRSAYNIGSIARTADGFGIIKIYCLGLTPFVVAENDDRPPHIKRKVIDKISKTALGAEKSVQLSFHPDLRQLILNLKKSGFRIVALEQASNSKPLKNFSKFDKIALLLGNEVRGLDPLTLKLCDELLEIPMLGTKESFNVSVAAAIAIYELKRSELY